MSNSKQKISRRDFFKASGLVAAGAISGPALLGGLKKAHAAVPNPNWDSKFSACDMCFNKCGLIARVEDGVVKKLDPNPKFLKSRGMLCARGNAGIDQVYDPDRLKHPLLRKGERGEGKWQRIPWDEAIDIAAQKNGRGPQKIYAVRPSLLRGGRTCTPNSSADLPKSMVPST